MKNFCLLTITVLGLSACVSSRDQRPQWPYPEPPGSPSGEIIPGVPDPRVARVEPPAATYPSSAEQDSGPAVISLLQQARQALDQGSPDEAGAILERAQRIEPRNPWVWQRLAAVRLAQGQAAQAEAMASKSNSLSRGNPWLGAENWRLISIAREHQGDMVGAREARDTWYSLRQTLPRS